MLWILAFIERAHARIEIPAVVVKLDGSVRDEAAYFRNGLLFKISESHDDVRDLNACVVDVVLNFYLTAGGFEDADERIPDCGVPQVPDVRCLVRIDVGVFDDNFAVILIRVPSLRRTTSSSKVSRMTTALSRKKLI
jgi:hypothetical protein